MKTIKGDIVKLALDGRFDVIVHGCNCFCTMGAGVAKLIKEEFPEVYESDCKTSKGDKSKLGTILPVEVSRNGFVFTVVNAYTQYKYRSSYGEKCVDYDAVRKCFREVSNRFLDKKIGYVKVGAGLAGGKWEIISDIIDYELAGLDHTLVEFDNG